MSDPLDSGPRGINYTESSLEAPTKSPRSALYSNMLVYDTDLEPLLKTPEANTMNTSRSDIHSIESYTEANTQSPTQAKSISHSTHSSHKPDPRTPTEDSVEEQVTILEQGDEVEKNVIFMDAPAEVDCEARTEACVQTHVEVFIIQVREMVRTLLATHPLLRPTVMSQIQSATGQSTMQSTIYSRAQAPTETLFKQFANLSALLLHYIQTESWASNTDEAEDLVDIADALEEIRKFWDEILGAKLTELKSVAWKIVYGEIERPQPLIQLSVKELEAVVDRSWWKIHKDLKFDFKKYKEWYNDEDAYEKFPEPLYTATTEMFDVAGQKIDLECQDMFNLISKYLEVIRSLHLPSFEKTIPRNLHVLKDLMAEEPDQMREFGVLIKRYLQRYHGYKWGNLPDLYADVDSSNDSHSSGDETVRGGKPKKTEGGDGGSDVTDGGYDGGDESGGGDESSRGDSSIRGDSSVGGDSSIGGDEGSGCNESGGGIGWGDDLEPLLRRIASM